MNNMYVILGVKNLRDKVKKANPEVKYVLSISDEHEILKSSVNGRREAIGHLTDILKQVSYK